MAYKPRMRRRRADKIAAQREAAQFVEAVEQQAVEQQDSETVETVEIGTNETEEVESQVSWDELADIRADDLIDVPPVPEVITEAEQQWPPKQHPRDETGVTTKEADILTQRAIRHGWIHAPFLTHVPKSELEQIPHEERTLEHKAVLSVHEALDAPSIKMKGRGATTAVLMVRANIAANQTKQANETTVNVGIVNAGTPAVQQDPAYVEWLREKSLGDGYSPSVGKERFAAKVLGTGSPAGA